MTDYGIEREPSDAEDASAATEEVARYCPKCEKYCGDAEYDPANPGVGIFGGCYTNECPRCGLFSTFDDGEQEMEKAL